MVKVIRCDFSKLFRNCFFYLCILGLGTVWFLMGMGQIVGRKSGGSFVSLFLYLNTNEIVLLSFLFCIVGGSYQYCSEEKYGYINFAILRTGVPRYCIGKLLSSAAGGFLTAFAGQVLVCIYMIFFSWIQYEDKSSIWPQPDELEHFMWVIVTFSMLCGVLSAVGFVVTTFMANYYIGISMPVLIYYAVLSVNQWLPVPENLKIENVYFNVSMMDGGYLPWVSYVCFYTVCLLCLFYFIVKYRIRRRLEHA